MPREQTQRLNKTPQTQTSLGQIGTGRTEVVSMPIVQPAKTSGARLSEALGMVANVGVGVASALYKHDKKKTDDAKIVEDKLNWSQYAKEKASALYQTIEADTSLSYEDKAAAWEAGGTDFIEGLRKEGLSTDAFITGVNVFTTIADKGRNTAIVQGIQQKKAEKRFVLETNSNSLVEEGKDGNAISKDYRESNLYKSKKEANVAYSLFAQEHILSKITDNPYMSKEELTTLTDKFITNVTLDNGIKLSDTVSAKKVMIAVKKEQEIVLTAAQAKNTEGYNVEIIDGTLTRTELELARETGEISGTQYVALERSLSADIASVTKEEKALLKDTQANNASDAQLQINKGSLDKAGLEKKLEDEDISDSQFRTLLGSLSSEETGARKEAKARSLSLISLFKAKGTLDEEDVGDYVTAYGTDGVTKYNEDINKQNIDKGYSTNLTVPSLENILPENREEVKKGFNQRAIIAFSNLMEIKDTEVGTDATTGEVTTEQDVKDKSEEKQILNYALNNIKRYYPGAYKKALQNSVMHYTSNLNADNYSDSRGAINTAISRTGGAMYDVLDKGQKQDLLLMGHYTDYNSYISAKERIDKNGGQFRMEKIPKDYNDRMDTLLASIPPSKQAAYIQEIKLNAYATGGNWDAAISHIEDNTKFTDIAGVKFNNELYNNLGTGAKTDEGVPRVKLINEVLTKLFKSSKVGLKDKSNYVLESLDNGMVRLLERGTNVVAFEAINLTALVKKESDLRDYQRIQKELYDKENGATLSDVVGSLTPKFMEGFGDTIGKAVSGGAGGVSKMFGVVSGKLNKQYHSIVDPEVKKLDMEAYHKINRGNN